MDIALNKQALDVLMPLCRKHNISPRWALIHLINSNNFEDLLLEAMELTNDKHTTD